MQGKSFLQKCALLLRFCLQTLDYHKKKMKRKVWVKEFKHVIRLIDPLSSYSFRYQNVSSFITREKKQMFVLMSQRNVNQNIKPYESKKAIKLDKRHIFILMSNDSALHLGCSTL